MILNVQTVFTFNIPLDLKYLTISGADANVTLILTGANTLWIAYATTNVLASATFTVDPSPNHGIVFKNDATSTPLQRRRKRSVNPDPRPFSVNIDATHANRFKRY